MSATSDRHRPGGTGNVFFALCPAVPCTDRLLQLAARLANDLGGKPVRPAKLHLTLAFVGRIDATRLPELLTMATALSTAARAGRLSLDHLRYLPSKHLLWAGCSQCPSPLSRLAGQLAEGLQALGYPVASPFIPHVTLLRRLPQAPAAGSTDALTAAPIDWPFDQFALLRSRQMSRDTVSPADDERLATWQLPDDSVTL